MLNFKNIFFRVSISIVSIIVCLIIAEFYYKLNSYHSLELLKIFKDSVNENILFELKPNQKINFTGINTYLLPTTIKISSQGIRDYEYEKIKPEDKYRIIIVSDSMGFGWGVEVEDSFAKKLERMLREASYNKYDVINFSCPGYNIAQEVATLETKCLIYSPDLIIFCMCINDYMPLMNYRRPLPKWLSVYIPEFLYKSYLFRYILTKIVINMEMQRKNEFNKGISEVDKAINKLRALMKKYRIKVLFYPDIEWVRPILEKYDLSDYVIPSNSLIWEDYNYKLMNDPHPNVLGHAKIAKELYDYLRANGYANN